MEFVKEPQPLGAFFWLVDEIFTSYLRSKKLGNTFKNYFGFLIKKVG